jgi:quercetin dioxygenase-like cupin family protein
MSQRPMEVGTTRGGEEREPRSLVKVGAFRLVLVALRSGAAFTESDQRGTVALQVLQGRVVLSVAEESVEVGQAEVAVVAPGQPWTAVAVADGLLLLHLAWPPEPASVAT